MKKRFWTGIITAALVLSVGSVNALAFEPQCADCPDHCGVDGAGVYYVDENGDGMCDNFASGVFGGGYGRGVGRQGRSGRGGGLGLSARWHIAEDESWERCVDADGDGMCDTCGKELSARAGFVDEDNDGVCDNFGSAACGGGYGCGVGRQGRSGRGGGLGLSGRWHIAEDESRERCVDADGDGMCDTCGKELSPRAGFVDEDNDGVCDNFGSAACGGGYGRGCHGGRRR